MAQDRGAASFGAARLAMVDRQIRPADVTRLDLIDALLWAPRERFVPKSRRAQAYIGEHVPIAAGRFELDPRVFAKMVDAAAPRADDLALVVGAGYGYAAAILSRLTEAVIALEQNDAMREASAQLMAEFELDNVAPVEGDLTAGCASHHPYNLIFVNGGVEIPPPAALLSQLANQGRLVAISMRNAVGRCRVWTRAGDRIGVWPAFDATAPLLPGFERKDEFAF